MKVIRKIVIEGVGESGGHIIMLKLRWWIKGDMGI